MRRKIFAVFLAMLVATSMVATPVAAALAFGGGDAPNPQYNVDSVTVDNYESSWGDALKYEDDSGDVADLPATVNRSDDVDDLGTGQVNPFTMTATDINFSDAGEFPRKSGESGDNKASALDASEYTSGANTTVSDVNTAPNVKAVEYDFQSGSSGQSATYGNFSITTDINKRHFQAFYDIESASGASTVTVTIHDATDGDTKTLELYNQSGDTSSASVGANSTGEGKVMQVQLGELTTSGGDGTLDEVGKIVVSSDGAANVDVSALNMEKTGQWKLGTEFVDTDSDDELETNDIYEATGPISIHSIETMGATFDDATIKGVSFPAHFRAQDMPDSSVEFNTADQYPGFDQVLNFYVDMELPEAYDLSYSGVELEQNTNWPGERYVAVELAEGVSDSTDYEDIDDSSWSDKTSSFDSQDKDITLDSTIQPGDRNVYHVKLKLTDDEAASMQASDGDGGGPGFLGGGSGGIIDSLLGLPGAIAALAIGLIQRARGKFPFGG